MNIVVHVHMHSEDSPALAAIQSALTILIKKVTHTMSATDDLTAAVAANGSGIASAISLLQGLKALLDAAIANLPDQSALLALSATLGADDATLAAAVLANTPTPTPPVLGTTSVSLTASANPAPLGGAVTLTATVSGTPTPTGTVSFLDGTTSLGVGTLASGVATLDTSFASTDPHSLTAEYSGDAASATSVSTALDLVVA